MNLFLLPFLVLAPAEALLVRFVALLLALETREIIGHMCHVPYAQQNFIC